MGGGVEAAMSDWLWQMIVLMDLAIIIWSLIEILGKLNKVLEVLTR